MNMIEYLAERQEMRRLTEKLFAYCKEYVCDESVDVWERFNFFATVAIEKHHDWYLYHNKAMENIKLENSDNLHEYLYNDSSRYSTVDCVEKNQRLYQ